MVNAWVSPIPNVPVQIFDSTIGDTKTVDTNSNGNFFSSPPDWARINDGYAVRPGQPPVCYVPPAMTTETDPPSTTLGSPSYEFQSAGNQDCGTNCNFEYNCADPLPIANLRPSGIVPTGPVKFEWDPVSCASRYMFRLDDLSNGWTGTCASVNPGDACVDLLTTTSYTYATIQAGHTYRVWVDSFNIGCWGPSVAIDVVGACGTPNTPSITAPLTNGCYKSDPAFTISQSDTASSCYPHDASGGVFVGASAIKTSLYGTNIDVLGAL